MKVKIDRLKLVKEIQKDLEEYKAEYVKAIEAYKTKVGHYSDYVQKHVMNKSIKSLESPPYPPTSKIKQFEDDLAVLNAHVEDNIIMEDNEYKDMKRGIENLKSTMTATTANYVATCYPSGT